MLHKQVEEMDNLNLFIDYHYKSIVSIIRERHVLTLHLSTANCRRKLTTGCCCKNTAVLYYTRYAIYFYQIESIPQFLELWPISMHFDGTNFTLLYRNATTYGIIVPNTTFLGKILPQLSMKFSTIARKLSTHSTIYRDPKHLQSSA